MDERQRFEMRWFSVAIPICLALATRAMLVAFSPAFAATSVESPISTEAPLPVSEPFRVVLENGEEIPAAFVRSWWNDYVRLADRFGHSRFIHANQVAAVLDSTGMDVTSRVVDGRMQLGTLPEFVEPPRVLKVRKYRSPLRANIAQGSFFRRTGSFEENRYGIILTQVDVGGLWKIGDRYGVGATVFASGDEEVVNTGVKVWGRRLLRRDLVFDLAPGVILASDDDYAARNFAPAFVCETGLTYNSWLSLAGMVEARARSSSMGTSESHTEWAGYFGLKLGGYAAAPAILVSTMAMLVTRSIETEFAPTP